jgi:hypothetical protein
MPNNSSIVTPSNDIVNHGSLNNSRIVTPTTSELILPPSNDNENHGSLNNSRIVTPSFHRNHNYPLHNLTKKKQINCNDKLSEKNIYIKKMNNELTKCKNTNKQVNATINRGIINNIVNETKLGLLDCGVIHMKSLNELVHKFSFNIGYKNTLSEWKTIKKSFDNELVILNNALISNTDKVFENIPSIIRGGKKTKKKQIKNNKTKKINN